MAKPSSAVFCWLRLQDIGLSLLSVRSSHASSTPLLCSSVSLYGVRHMAKPSSAVFCWLRLQDIGLSLLSVRSSHASSTPLLCSSVSLYGVRHMVKPSSVVFCRLRLQDIGRRFYRMCGSGITTCKDNLRSPSLLPACSNHGILFCVLL